MRRSDTSIIRLISTTLAALTAFVLFALPAKAEVQAPQINKRTLQARRTVILRGRSQRFSPAQRRALVTRISGMNPTSTQFKEAISIAPLKVRAKIYKQQGTEVQSFERRLRGMLKAGKTFRVVSSKKTFVDVTTANFDTFRKTMGQNVVWFAVNSSPGHLHTLVADQGGGDAIHHNTYGTSTNAATINSSYTQYALPVQLTDKQMDRFVRYLNAGTANSSNKSSVFGFKTSSGTLITNTACTNWATTAPIGDLPRWAKTVEKRVRNLNVPELAQHGGLHGALAKAPDAAARQAIVSRVLASNGMTKWTKSAVKRMAKAFNKELTNWPNRPKDMVLRTSMSQMLGLSRSQDPAKWSYDLLMSKKVPVVAVTSGSKLSDFANMEFNMELMGKVGPTGLVTAGQGSHGVIPADRRPAAPQPATAAE